MADRIADIADRLTTIALAGVDLLDDQEAKVLVDELPLDERKELMTLMRKKLAHSEEVLEAELEELDAMQAAIEIREQFDRKEIDRPEAERRLDEIDRASGGAVSRLWPKGDVPPDWTPYGD